MMILHFAPNFQKMHFCTTANFGVKSYFWKHSNSNWKTGNANNLFEKNILAYIFFDIIEYIQYGLYYMKPSEDEFDSKTWQG